MSIKNKTFISFKSKEIIEKETKKMGHFESGAIKNIKSKLYVEHPWVKGANARGNWVT